MAARVTMAAAVRAAARAVEARAVEARAVDATAAVVANAAAAIAMATKEAAFSFVDRDEGNEINFGVARGLAAATLGLHHGIQDGRCNFGIATVFRTC